MLVWEQQLDQMLDQVADYAEGWDELLEMVASADKPSERKTLRDYLEYLVPRLKQMRRVFNRVEYDAKTESFTIYNYTFAMFKYMREAYQDHAVFTANRIVIASEVLTDLDRDKLRKQLVA